MNAFLCINECIFIIYIYNMLGVLGVASVIYMNMNVANDGCCAKKEDFIAWLQVLLYVVATYGSHPYEAEVLIKRLVKEAWELLLISTN
jgi:hypothetical protein